MPQDRDDSARTKLDRIQRERKELGLIEPLPPDYSQHAGPRKPNAPVPKPGGKPLKPGSGSTSR